MQIGQIYEQVNELSQGTNYFAPGGEFLIGALHSRDCTSLPSPSSLPFPKGGGEAGERRAFLVAAFAMLGYVTATVERQERFLATPRYSSFLE